MKAPTFVVTYTSQINYIFLDVLLDPKDYISKNLKKGENYFGGGCGSTSSPSREYDTVKGVGFL